MLGRLHLGQSVHNDQTHPHDRHLPTVAARSVRGGRRKSGLHMTVLRTSRCALATLSKSRKDVHRLSWTRVPASGDRMMASLLFLASYLPEKGTRYPAEGGRHGLLPKLLHRELPSLVMVTWIFSLNFEKMRWKVCKVIVSCCLLSISGRKLGSIPGSLISSSGLLYTQPSGVTGLRLSASNKREQASRLDRPLTTSPSHPEVLMLHGVRRACPGSRAHQKGSMIPQPWKSILPS